MAIFGLGSGRFEVDEPFTTNKATQAIDISSTTPIVLATIDFADNPLYFRNSLVWLTAAVGWKAVSLDPILEFSIFTADPTIIPPPMPSFVTRDDPELSNNHRFTTGFNHIDTPVVSAPIYFLTANLAPGGFGTAQIVGPITFTAAEIGQV
jgi:hypothetical protein